ncbi:hypothetical protein L873DRAFT_1792493 [Choiromyces venosus 120613-1]|uniref:Uncharacterized protein n=1 Tax=Choiromyces venosus 120613-1 TaxID=1336337 RepID=A0A3N4JA55_9PEZI|nr:hypothetical protein L873DRAFT_1792493 [Choiromyces venosus 120613-1]
MSLELKLITASREITAIIHGNNMYQYYRIQIQQQIDILSPFYKPLQYPLLFPDGTSDQLEDFEERIYFSHDSIKEYFDINAGLAKIQATYKLSDLITAQEQLNDLSEPSLPPHKLRLRVSAVCILM